MNKSFNEYIKGENVFTKKVGDFQLTKSVVRISDPCYDRSTWCAGTVDNVLPGTWTSKVVKFTHEETDWGERVGELIAQHKDYDIKDVDWEHVNIDVGVDSGQAGIFDDSQFKNNMSKPHKLTGNAEYDTRNFTHSMGTDIELLGKIQEQFGDQMSSSLHVKFSCMMLDIAKEKMEWEEKYTKNIRSETDFYEVCCDKTLSNLGA